MNQFNSYSTFRTGYEMRNVTFTSGQSFNIEVKIPLTLFDDNKLSSIPFREHSIEIDVFYNGEYVSNGQRSTYSKQVKKPSLVYYDYTPLKLDRAIVVTLELPQPILDDEGIYEIQVLYDSYDITRRFPSNCSDYKRFIESSDGLDLDWILVGSATLMLQANGTQIKRINR